LTTIKSKYKWAVDLERMKPVTKHLEEHKEGRITIGYRLGVHSSTDQENGLLHEFFTHGLYADYKLTNNILLYTGFNLSLNLTDPQTAAQSQIFDQIDIQGALAGTNLEQTVDLNLKLKGQIHLGTQMGIKYLFNTKTSFNPYLQSNISLPISRDLQGTLDTTLTINVADAFTGGLNSGISREDLDPKSAGLTEKRARNLNWGVGGGIQIKLSSYLRFDMGLDFSRSMLNLEKESFYHSNNFNVSFGLNVRFRDRKKYFLKHYY